MRKGGTQTNCRERGVRHCNGGLHGLLHYKISEHINDKPWYKPGVTVHQQSRLITCHKKTSSRGVMGNALGTIMNSVQLLCEFKTSLKIKV